VTSREQAFRTLTKLTQPQKWEGLMSKIFLIDTNKKPLNPIHPAIARQLLRNKKAAIFHYFL
jgi:hypothetical protein